MCGQGRPDAGTGQFEGQSRVCGPWSNQEVLGDWDRIDDDVNRNTDPAPGVPLGKQADPRLGLLGLLGPQIPSCQEAGVVECWCGRRTVSALGSRPSTTIGSRPSPPHTNHLTPVLLFGHAATPRPADDAALLLDSRARNCNRMHPVSDNQHAGHQQGSSRVPFAVRRTSTRQLPRLPQPPSATIAAYCVSFPALRLSLRVWFNVTSTSKHGPGRGYSAGVANVAPRLSWQPSSRMLALVGQIGFIPVGSHIRPPVGLSGCRPVHSRAWKNPGRRLARGGIEFTFSRAAVAIYRACASTFSQLIALRRERGETRPGEGAVMVRCLGWERGKSALALAMVP